MPLGSQKNSVIMVVEVHGEAYYKTSVIMLVITCGVEHYKFHN